MLEHTGRRTGLRRSVVLEVVGHPSPSTYVVAAGFGPTSQWLRNVEADPNVRVRISGDPPRSATARILTRAEASGVLRTYAEQHPRAWSSLKPILERTLAVSIDPDNPALPMVALDLVAPRA
jgi:deazaflavin-dependent oxidoreductase (nitroreductase family)